jgi:steroid delta-isomerase-like uncharacterized protein
VTTVTTTTATIGGVSDTTLSATRSAGLPADLPVDALRAERERAVREHIRAEMAGDLDATIATFPVEAQYDIVPLGEVHTGAEAVRGLLAHLLGAFPDLGLHPDVIRHADDAVVIEGRMTGTHLGPYAGFAPAGGSIDLRAAIFFTFDGDVLLRETVYYDELTLLVQIGAVAAPGGAPPSPPDPDRKARP